nr:maleylacetate reductase [Pseudonocardia endophytica]
MTAFRYRALPMRVLFGPGRLAELPAELDELGLSRALVVSTPGHRELGDRVAALIGDRAAGVHARAVMHVPSEVADAAVTAAREAEADCCVAVGGGSTVGLAKAVALADGLPVVAVPTTYAGSEMTPVWGTTEGGVKRTGRDPRVLPVSVVYDPELTLTMPPELSVVSAINALAHSAEALYAPDGSPIVSVMAEESALAAGLPRVVKDPTDVDGRSDTLYGAWLAGACLGATTMGLHHKLCHTLGGALNLPHAPTHTVVLPYVLAFNAGRAPDAMAALGRALGRPAPGAVRDLAVSLGAPTSLRELGAAREDMAGVAATAAASPYGNPRPTDEGQIADLLDRAWAGAELETGRSPAPRRAGRAQ